jgi:undecaprenyl-diphosphatase
MDLLAILILAVVQGLTEFLPVSSSGHLLVAAEICRRLNLELPTNVVAISIVLHVGTLASILVFYRRRIGRLVGQDRNVIGLLLVGTLPAVVIGLPIKLFASDQLLNNLLLAGAMFPVTGALLLWASRHSEGRGEYPLLSYRQAALIGLFQAFAILPGVSRSGATLTAGLLTGLDRENAASFAFLLAIPAIAGAGLLEAIDLAREPASAPPLATLLLGAAVSFAVGLVGLWWLTAWVRRGRLAMFAWYCIPLGFVVVAWALAS